MAWRAPDRGQPAEKLPVDSKAPLPAGCPQPWDSSIGLPSAPPKLTGRSLPLCPIESRSSARPTCPLPPHLDEPDRYRGPPSRVARARLVGAFGSCGRRFASSAGSRQIRRISYVAADGDPGGSPRLATPRRRTRLMCARTEAPSRASRIGEVAAQSLVDTTPIRLASSSSLAVQWLATPSNRRRSCNSVE